jgi:squalene cyclase
MTRLAQYQHWRTGGVRTYAESGPIRRYTGLPRYVPFWGWCQPTVEVSAVAGVAFTVTGAKGEAQAAWRYVRARQARDGHWDAYWWNSPLVATWHAVALAGARGDQESQRRAAAWAVETQLRDGTWRSPRLPGPSAFASASALAVLASSDAGYTVPLGRAVAALASMQRVDGGWPPHALLRIPVPADRSLSMADRWRPARFEPGLLVSDHNRFFTTAACVAALASALARRLRS